MLGREFVRNLPGAVGGIAVHDEHVHLDRQRQKPLHHAREIFPFIDRRQDDERAVHAARG